MAALPTLFPAPAEDVAPLEPSRRRGQRLRREAGFWVGVTALFGLTLVATLWVWVMIPLLVPSWGSTVVRSGSMAPTIRTGDVVVYSEQVPDDLGPGAVAIYPDAAGDHVVHRVIDRRPDGKYTLKGDANNRPDTEPVARERMVGWGQLLVPFIGQPRVWLLHGELAKLAAGAVAAVLAVRASRRVWDPSFDRWRNEDRPAAPVDPGSLGGIDDGPDLLGVDTYDALFPEAAEIRS